ncbi:chromate efflux transporter [Candidatus Binatus sp.]|uniref:chromate efflux transporter n=2 Tax=Candidatus Binatus sp. TaxID=2811406 RepID=UPI003BB0B228
MDQSISHNTESPPPRREALRELAVLFLRLGTLAMGGPAAHIAMMEDEVVRRRRWMTHDRFLDMLGVCNLIPGPNSTEMAIHIGQLRAGFAGLVVAGACFILPAAAIVLAIAWTYVRFGTMPQAVGLLYGIKPVIIAVVLQALWGLGRTAIKSRLLAVLAIVTLIASLLDVNDMIVLLGGGIVMLAIRAVEDRAAARATLAAIPVAARAAATKGVALAAAAVAVPFSLTTLFLFFLKVGAVLFGSGYVLLAFLRTDLVDRLRWLTEAQLLDAVAVGQITPGPVFTTATFIGYLLGGFRGAVVATLGIFLPSFFFVSISGPLIPHLRRSPLAGAFLDGVNVGAWSLMAAVTLFLARAAVIDFTTLLLAISSAVVLIRYRVNSAWLVLGGGMIGLVMTLWR